MRKKTVPGTTLLRFAGVGRVRAFKRVLSNSFLERTARRLIPITNDIFFRVENLLRCVDEQKIKN